MPAVPSAGTDDGDDDDDEKDATKGGAVTAVSVFGGAGINSDDCAPSEKAEDGGWMAVVEENDFPSGSVNGPEEPVAPDDTDTDGSVPNLSFSEDVSGRTTPPNKNKHTNNHTQC